MPLPVRTTTGPLTTRVRRRDEGHRGQHTSDERATEPTRHCELAERCENVSAATGLARELGDSGHRRVQPEWGLFGPYTLAALRRRSLRSWRLRLLYRIQRQDATFGSSSCIGRSDPFLMPSRDRKRRERPRSLVILKRKNWLRRRTWLVVITNALATRARSSMTLQTSPVCSGCPRQRLKIFATSCRNMSYRG